MVANANDLYVKTGEGTATTLASPGYTISDTSITVVSTTNWPTDTGVIFAIDVAEVVDGEQVQVAGTYCEFEGVVSGATSITSVDLVAGTPQNYAAGALTRVYIPLSSEVQNRMVDGFVEEHAQDGTHTDITTTSINNAGAMIQTGPLTLKTYDGWIQATDTWTYASATTITVAGVDVTGLIEPGDRLKITQTTAKYFIVTKVAFSTNSTITVYGGTDYTVANAAITNPAYSRDKSPFGFPTSPTKWTIETSNTTARSTNSVTLATLTDTITVPIGAWRVSLQAPISFDPASATGRTGRVTLSTDASTETTPALTISVETSGVNTGRVGHQARVSTDVLLTSDTTYTLMGIVNSTGANIYVCAVQGTKYLRATSAYL